MEFKIKYDHVKELNNEKFRRLKRVKEETFNRMISILREADLKKKAWRQEEQTDIIEKRFINCTLIYKVI
jgi:hypothetical protein